jgi:hypothetical protein
MMPVYLTRHAPKSYKKVATRKSLTSNGAGMTNSQISTASPLKANVKQTYQLVIYQGMCSYRLALRFLNLKTALTVLTALNENVVRLDKN